MPAPVLVFDINGTLIDLAPLDAPFSEVFGTAEVRQQWFGRLLQSAMALTLSGRYIDFSTLADCVLEAVAASRNVSLTAAAKTRIFDCLATLPPYPDVAESLGRLRTAGFRVAALTNSPPASALPLLEQCGLAERFECILSVDEMGRFKPAAEPYEMAARKLGTTTLGLCMVAAHDWDICGAANAGCRTAFVARPGQSSCGEVGTADLSGRDLYEIADQLIARYA